MDTKDARIQQLEVRLVQLEHELTEQARRSAEVVARSQEKLYWLERWQVDLDALMRKPGAIPALEALKRGRGAIRVARRAKRRLSAR